MTKGRRSKDEGAEDGATATKPAKTRELLVAHGKYPGKRVCLVRQATDAEGEALGREQNAGEVAQRFAEEQGIADTGHTFRINGDELGVDDAIPAIEEGDEIALVVAQ